jgi:hypothetical protein
VTPLIFKQKNPRGHEYQTNHVITGDLNIIKNTSLEMFAKGPKYREPKPVPTFDHTLFEYCNKPTA